VGTFNFSAKYLSKKDSSTMLPPHSIVNVNKQLKKGSTRVFFYFDKTTEEVTIIQLVTILPIYKVQKRICPGN
jgi:hypothetical protein